MPFSPSRLAINHGLRQWLYARWQKICLYALCERCAPLRLGWPYCENTKVGERLASSGRGRMSVDGVQSRCSMRCAERSAVFCVERHVACSSSHGFKLPPQISGSLVPVKSSRLRERNIKANESLLRVVTMVY